MDVKIPVRRDAEATRARILEAAKVAFSQTGYSCTGVREIASMAGTSSTLVLRYFGSKVGLFEAALRDVMPIERLVAMPLEELTRELIDKVPDLPHAARPMLMIAMASGDPVAAKVAAEVFTERSIVPIGAVLGGPDGNVRSLEISILVIGFVLFLKHLPLTVFSAEDIGKLREWFALSVLEVARVNPGVR